MENKNKLITTMQSLILALGVFYLFEARIMFRYYNIESLMWQIVYFLSWAFIIFATIRIPKKSLKKWEAILYFILDIICVALIIYSVFYVGVTYEDFIGEEDSGLGYMFMMILVGLPYFITTVILSIISLVKIGFTKTKNKVAEDTNNSVKEIVQIQQSKQENTENKNTSEIYCSYCGNSIKSDAIYCKYCGKKVE